MRAWLVLVLLVACKSSSEPESIAIEDYGAARAAAVCKTEVTCRHEPSVEACFLSRCPETFPPADVADELAAGTVIYDGEAAAACLASIRDSDCRISAVRGNDLSSCIQELRGTVAAGEPCPCSSQGNTAGSYPTCYTCVTGYCNDSSGTCAQPPAAAGESCEEVRCAEGLYCDGTCKPRLAEGEACPGVESFSCEDGLRCYPDGEGFRCQVPPAAGAACTASQPFASNDCDDGPSGFVCDQTSMTCESLPVIGEACGDDPSTRCVVLAYCKAGTCAARGDSGDACEVGASSCLSGLECVDGVCAAACPGQGEPAFFFRNAANR